MEKVSLQTRHEDHDGGRPQAIQGDPKAITCILIRDWEGGLTRTHGGEAVGSQGRSVEGRWQQRRRDPPHPFWGVDLLDLDF